MKIIRRATGGVRVATKIERKPSGVNLDEARVRLTSYSRRTKSRFVQSLTLQPMASPSGDSGALAGPIIRHSTSGQIKKTA